VAVLAACNKKEIILSNETDNLNMQNYKKVLSFFISLLTVNVLFAQVTVTGTVTDSLGKPLQSVSITLKKNNGIVLSFAITNATGVYKLQYNNASSKDSLLVEANAIGFKKQSIPVGSAIQTSNFKLTATATKLPNITVQNSKAMLKKEGDTLNYDVASFSNKQDRTIGDVIKKLPGVEVSENGQISYGGKPINRFYIDGDNLLDGKYNIATNGIPNDMVAKVQVLENHQPINALKDAVKSESAAMNIVLKDKARLKIMGTGDLALGTPSVYNTTVNTMLFKKQVKFMNYIKLNNNGVDLAYETINHFGFENQPPPTLVSASTGSNPDLPKKRWLFNNAGLINVNDLVNLKKDLQLRINCYYLFDRQYQTSQYSSTYFLPTDTIRYGERQDSKTVSNSLNTQFTLTANRKDYYLNNVTIVDNTPSVITSDLQASSSADINQRLSGTITNISNKFNIINKSKSGKVWEGFSFINNIRNPATLQVEPGLYPALLNNNIPYAGLIQDAAIPTFYTNNYIAHSIVTQKFQQNYKIGFNYQDQQLNSILESEQLNGSKALVADSFRNNLDWSRFKAYVQADYTYTSGRVMLRAYIPVIYQDTKYKGRLVQNHLTDLPVSPRFSVKYNTGKESYINVDYNYGNSWANIDQVYDSYIMRNYRFFYTNGSVLNEEQAQTLKAVYVFKNTLKIFFYSIGGSYSKSINSTINDAQISAVGQQSKLVPFQNVSNSSQVYGTISKYIFPLLTTIGAKASWNRSLSNQLQNGDLFRMQNDTYIGSVNLNTKFSSWLNMSYTGSYMNYGGKPLDEKQSSTPVSRVEKMQHEVSANFNFTNNFYVRVGGENSSYRLLGTTNSSSFTFIDASCTYKLNKLKTDIELSMTNLAGMDTYSTASLSANSIVESSYRIRPRMVMVKCYFRF
jgi:hypothetical protein